MVIHDQSEYEKGLVTLEDVTTGARETLVIDKSYSQKELYEYIDKAESIAVCKEEEDFFEEMGF